MVERTTKPHGLTELARQALSGRVAREITHRINGLLVGVVSIASKAINEGTDDELRRALETNAHYGERIAELVRAFQTLFPGHDLPPAPGPADLAAALDRCITVCRRLAADRDVEIRKTYGALPRVQADVAPLEQVIIELLYRSLDLAPSHGTLELAAEERGGFVAVTITTPAVGATGEPARWPDDVGKALELCRTLEADTDGRGGPEIGDYEASADSLALAIAISAVRRHGGEFVTTGALGTGFQITVTWPIHAAETAEQEPADTPPPDAVSP